MPSPPAPSDKVKTMPAEFVAELVVVDSLESEIRRLVLENAVKYEGKPSAKSVMSALLGSRADLRSRAKEVKDITERVVAEVSGLTLVQQQEQLASIGPEGAVVKRIAEVERPDQVLPDLPNLGNWPKVVMRLAPFPSGPLHIGNARMVVLNDYYVKRYNGELLLVIDDTIGSTDKQIEPDAYDLIPEGLAYLGVNYHRTIFKSDRLDIFYQYSVDLIKRGQAYVCTCDAEVWRTENKVKGKACSCRSISAEENLDRWQKMLDGAYAQGKAALRMKTGMDQPDPAMRDHVIMRISETPHPRVGTKYRVWPLLEFSWGVDDHELGVTHIIRGKDLVKEGKIEQHVWRVYGWKEPELLYYGRMKIEDARLSKSKSRKEVKDGVFSGWDDPRTWSLQSLAKRGIHPDAIRKVMLELGLSLADTSVSVKAIYSENRKLRDADAPRLFFVQDPVWLHMDGFPARVKAAEAPVHPDFPERGVRHIPISRVAGRVVVGIQRADYDRLNEGQLFRLKDFANVTIQKGEEPSATFHSQNVEQALKVKAPIMQWVPKKGVSKVFLTMIDGAVIEGLAEPETANMVDGSFVQFERYGFVRFFEVSPIVKAAFAHK